MNNYKEEKQKIKTLSQFISNYLEVKEIAEEDEQLKAFLEMIAYDDFKDDIEALKYRLIPKDLIKEVEFYIEKQYKGNAEAYLKTIDIYFESFGWEALSKCNIRESRLFEESTVAGKRKLNRERKHNLWHASVLLKLVGKKRAKYSCSTIFNEFKESKKKEFEFIKNCKIVGEDKKVLKLSDCVKSSKQAIAEKINLIKVQEKIAEQKGWTWVFITLTLPGEYHPNPLLGKNTYNGVSPRESAKILNMNIKRVRALLQKWNIKAGKNYIGCSSAEAHKDGVLHKHMLFFCSQDMLEDLRKAFEVHFPNLNDKSFAVNNGKAKASSYVFKYVMKSITSYDSSIDFENMENGDKGAVLNNAFRSFNFIRGFSFFGIDNCLTKFRFIARNLKDMNLPVEISSLVEENNLYELLTKGFFDMFKNIYKKDGENRVFVGCSFNGNEYFKKFFSLVRNAVNEIKEEVKSMYAEMALNRRKSLLNVVVILNHNYSRDEQARQIFEEKCYHKWLFKNRDRKLNGFFEDFKFMILQNLKKA
ncbi:replication endonuclease [Comamonas testosteroni]|uniref:replication endonuclease n=1 Tax=Comamonas testosteroni TaxID=285 RepID=UPI0026EA9465|nr:replication endonuclease [Comamonas testosteroni]